MIASLVAPMLAMLALNGQAATMNTTYPYVVDTVSGANFAAIQAAMEVFKLQKVEVRDCEIQAGIRADKLVVVFSARGALPFEVEMLPEVLTVVRSGPVSAPGTVAPLTAPEKLRGSSYRVMEAAAVTAREKKLNLAFYRINAMAEGDSPVVTFVDKDAAPQERGNPGKRPGLEVHLDRGLRVTRSNYIR